ncbi:hypothetical protein [Streptomyces sp. UNOB3_S3]|uniref:hypothetical protein n=1 Tax=Streptomyces sp. UNOB3_S3 TaxID=2871682 RepID=UPI001E5EA92B|nr:hypothetical protein [Streptomyces sp. UNOB3_S3]MCC3777476.1 hypothetical protein [Streptomyces sp. UNOB3_S3]
MRRRLSRRLATVAAATVVAAAGVMATGGTASAARDDARGVIWNDETLTKGSSLKNDYVQLVMQDDGNLVTYSTDDNRAHRKPTWHTDTAGCGDRAMMQSDGNFVVYGQGNRVCWTSNTKPNRLVPDSPVLKLGVFTDGTVKVFSEAPYIVPVWSSR